MKLYNKYLIYKIISCFLVTFSTLILLIWFAKAISFIGYITEQGINFSDFINLFILILPWLSIIIIPVSLFVAILIVYNQMLSHNEIVILKNTGLNNLKLANPAIIVAVLCCLLSYFVSLFLMPYANKKLRVTKLDFRNNYVNLLINPGVFETFNGLTIYVKNRDIDNNLFGILIYDKRDLAYPIAITSTSGILKQNKQNNDSLLLYLDQGTIERFNKQNNKIDILNFDSYVINLSDNNQSNATIVWKANERYISELLNPEKDSSKYDLTNYRIELHQRIADPLLSLVLTLIAVVAVLKSKFSRYGNLAHTLKAIFFAVTFIVLFMSSYNLAEYSYYLTSVIYINILIFVLFSIYFLRPR